MNHFKLLSIQELKANFVKSTQVKIIKKTEKIQTSLIFTKFNTNLRMSECIAILKNLKFINKYLQLKQQKLFLHNDTEKTENISKIVLVLSIEIASLFFILYYLFYWFTLEKLVFPDK